MADEVMQVTLELDADASNLLATYRAALEELDALTSSASTVGGGAIIAGGAEDENYASSAGKIQSTFDVIGQAIDDFNLGTIAGVQEIQDRVNQLRGGGAISEVAGAVGGRGGVGEERFTNVAREAQDLNPSPVIFSAPEDQKLQLNTKDATAQIGVVNDQLDDMQNKLHDASKTNPLDPQFSTQLQTVTDKIKDYQKTLSQGIAGGVIPKQEGDQLRAQLDQELQRAQQLRLAYNTGQPVESVQRQATQQAVRQSAVVTQEANLPVDESEGEKRAANQKVAAATNAEAQAILAKSQTYKNNVAQGESSSAQIKAGVQSRLASDDLYKKATADAAASQAQIKAGVQIRLSADDDYIKATAQSAEAQASIKGQVAQRLLIEGDYVKVEAQAITAQTELNAAIKEQLATAGAIAGSAGSYAAALAQAKAAQTKIAADEDTVLLGIQGYAESLAAAKLAHAQEDAKVQEILAADNNYIAALAEAANSQKLLAARAADATARGVGSEGHSPQGLILPAPEGSSEEVAGVIEERRAANVSALAQEQGQAKVSTSMASALANLEAAMQKRVQYATDAASQEAAQADLLKTRTDYEAKLASGTLTEVDVLGQTKAYQDEVAAAIKQQASAARRAAYEQGGSRGDFVQRFQAGVASRNGEFQNPNDYLNLTQFIKSRFLTTAGFAVSGVATYAAFAGLQKVASDAAALEKTLAQIKAEFTALGDGNSFNGFRNGILSISQATGEAENSVAQLALSFKGAFGSSEDNSQILSQVQSAVELSKVTGISLSDITNNLTSVALTFGTTITGVGNLVLTLQDTTGVAASESIQAISDMQDAAVQAGATIQQVGALAAVAAQHTGQSGATIAEGLNRILPAIQGKAADIIQTLQTAAPSQVPQAISDLASGNTFAVFDLIGKNFKNLTRDQQDFLASLLGSRRDAKTAIDVWQNYAEVLQVTGDEYNDSGRLATSYGQLQETLSQQLSRVGTAIRAVGQDLLSLGISTFIQELAKALSAVINAGATVVSVFTAFNNLTHGLIGNAAALATGLLAVAKVLEAIQTAGIGGAAANAARSIPIIGGKIGGKVGEEEATTSGAVLSGNTLGSNGEILSEGDAAITGAAATGLLAPLKNLYTSIATALKSYVGSIGEASAAADGTLLSLGAGVGAALEGFIGLISSPFLVIPAVIESINSIAGGWSTASKQLTTAQGNYAEALKNATTGSIVGGTADSNQAKQYDNTYFHVEHPAESYNPFTDIRRAAGILRGESAPTSGDIADQEILRRNSQQFSQALEDVSAVPKKRLQDAIDSYNKSVDNLQRGSSFPKISSQEVSEIASGKLSVTDHGKFEGIIAIFTNAAKNNPALGKALKDLLDQQDQTASALANAASSTADLPTLEAAGSLGQITPQGFASKALVAQKDNEKVLSESLSKGITDPTILQPLEQAIQQGNTDFENQLGKYLTDLVSTKAVLESLSGGTELQTETEAIASNVEALSQPGSALTTEAPTLAQNILTAQQNQLQYLYQHATSIAAQQKILDTPVKIPTQALDILNAENLRTLPADKEVVFARAATHIGTTTADIIARIAAHGTDLEKGVDEWVAELKTDEQALIARGIDPTDIRFKNIAATIAGLQHLNIKSVSPYINATNPDTPTTDQLVSAKNAFETALAGADPAKQAAVQQAEAQLLVTQAKAYRETAAEAAAGAAGLKEYNTERNFMLENAATAFLQANQASQAAADSILTSQGDILEAQAGSDPVSQATAGLAAAQLGIQAAANQGTAAQNEARATYIQAQNAAIAAQQQLIQAQGAVATALANGDPLKAAQAALALANEQAATATGPVEAANALAAQITAKNQIAQAITGMMDAQSQLLQAVATGSGDVILAAREAVAQAQNDYNRLIAEGTSTDSAAAKNAYTNIVNAQTNLRNTVLQQSEDNINYLLQTQQISDGNAIARLRTLLQSSKLTASQQQQIKEQIFSIEQSEQQNLQFNLPSIDLPTLYEARRFDQTGGGQGQYNDNRVLNLTITTNSKTPEKEITKAVTKAFTAPARFGTRTKAY